MQMHTKLFTMHENKLQKTIFPFRLHGPRFGFTMLSLKKLKLPVLRVFILLHFHYSLYITLFYRSAVFPDIEIIKYLFLKVVKWVIIEIIYMITEILNQKYCFSKANTTL